MTHIAGAYRATYKGLSLGQTDDGFDIDQGAVIEDITSDFFRAREDGVYQGIDMVVRCILNEPDLSGVKALYWPYDSTLGDSGIPGRLMTTMAGPLILTACAGTTAASDIAVITFSRAIIWTDRIVQKYANVQRKIPVTIAILPVPEPAASSAGNMGCSGGVFYITA